MKRSTVTIAVLISLLLVLLAAAFATVSTANAQLGNTGVPVHCDSGGTVAAGATVDLYCYRPDESSFTTVPSNYYLLVTDMIAVQTAGSVARWQFSLCKETPSSVAFCLWSTTDRRGDFGQHYNSPPIVLSSGQKLHSVNQSDSGGEITIIVTGILTTNYDYLPIVAR